MELKVGLHGGLIKKPHEGCNDDCDGVRFSGREGQLFSLEVVRPRGFDSGGAPYLIEGGKIILVRQRDMGESEQVSSQDVAAALKLHLTASTDGKDLY